MDIADYTVTLWSLAPRSGGGEEKTLNWAEMFEKWPQTNIEKRRLNFGPGHALELANFCYLAPKSQGKDMG